MNLSLVLRSSYHDFSPAKAYTVLTLFNIIQVPLRIVVYLLSTLIVAKTSLIGFPMTWIFLISQMLSFALTLTADTENLMSSVQKINYYIENTPQEPNFDFPKPKSAVGQQKA